MVFAAIRLDDTSVSLVSHHSCFPSDHHPQKYHSVVRFLLIEICIADCEIAVVHPWEFCLMLRNIDFNISEILYADLLVAGFYILMTILAGIAFIAAINIFRNKPTWGQVRVMGAPFFAFVLIQGVFYLALFEGTIGLIDLIVGVPLWVDLAIFATIILLVLLIFLILFRRSTFKPHLFVALVVVQLGFPGAHLVAYMTEQGAVEIGQRGIVRTLRYGGSLSEVRIQDVDNVAQAIPIIRGVPRTITTVVGNVRFANTFEIGALGDYLTAKRLGSMGYHKLPSKINKIHGIDGIYIKKSPSGTMTELLIVENKVGSSRLSPRQMSESWIMENVEKMRLSSDRQVQTTGDAIFEAMSSNPEIIQRQIWNHNIETGGTVVRKLNQKGKPGDVLYDWSDRFIENTINQRCASGTLMCVP